MPRDEYAAIMVEETVRCMWCGLPVTDGQCLKCFPPTRPSREAMIRQAVLDTLHERCPTAISVWGLANTCRSLLHIMNEEMAWSICTKFHAAVARYDLQEIAANGHE